MARRWVSNVSLYKEIQYYSQNFIMLSLYDLKEEIESVQNGPLKVDRC